MLYRCGFGKDQGVRKDTRRGLSEFVILCERFRVRCTEMKTHLTRARSTYLVDMCVNEKLASRHQADVLTLDPFKSPTALPEEDTSDYLRRRLLRMESNMQKLFLREPKVIAMSFTYVP